MNQHKSGRALCSRIGPWSFRCKPSAGCLNLIFGWTVVGIKRVALYDTALKPLATVTWMRRHRVFLLPSCTVDTFLLSPELRTLATHEKSEPLMSPGRILQGPAEAMCVGSSLLLPDSFLVAHLIILMRVMLSRVQPHHYYDHYHVPLIKPPKPHANDQGPFTLQSCSINLVYYTIACYTLLHNININK